MVTRTLTASPDEPDFDRWEADLTKGRASRRHPKGAYRRQHQRRIVVRGERLPEPDVSRLSRALLQAQRELAQAQAEAEAQRQATPHVDGENGDDRP
jgi:hypothetical protein